MIDRRQWHVWYAWYPVRTPNGWMWLTRVERRWVISLWLYRNVS